MPKAISKGGAYLVDFECVDGGTCVVYSDGSKAVYSNEKFKEHFDMYTEPFTMTEPFTNEEIEFLKKFSGKSYQEWNSDQHQMIAFLIFAKIITYDNLEGKVAFTIGGKEIYDKASRSEVHTYKAAKPIDLIGKRCLSYFLFRPNNGEYDKLLFMYEGNLVAVIGSNGFESKITEEHLNALGYRTRHEDFGTIYIHMKDLRAKWQVLCLARGCKC